MTRYRMTVEELMDVAVSEHVLGLGTLVLQTGDGAYLRDDICRWISAVLQRYPGLAITLSLGERPVDDYRAFRDAGADRYLLKHQTIKPALYERLHPRQKLSLRLKLLEMLRQLGYQVDARFIVGLSGR